MRAAKIRAAAAVDELVGQPNRFWKTRGGVFFFRVTRRVETFLLEYHFSVRKLLACSPRGIELNAFSRRFTTPVDSRTARAFS